MTSDTTQRRPRGPSPLGDFEQSKETALAELERKRIADRQKSERLKALRLSKAAGVKTR